MSKMEKLEIKLITFNEKKAIACSLENVEKLQELFNDFNRDICFAVQFMMDGFPESARSLLDVSEKQLSQIKEKYPKSNEAETAQGMYDFQRKKFSELYG